MEKKTLDPNFRPKFSNFKYLLFLSKEKCVSSQIIIDTQISAVFLKNINQVFIPTTAQRQHRTVCTNDLLLAVDSWACAILFFPDFHCIHDFLCMYFIYDLFISFYWVSIWHFGSWHPFTPPRKVCLTWPWPDSALICQRGRYGKAYLISSLSSWPLTISSVLYELPLGQIIHQYNINFHRYIHDTQLNVPLAGSDASFHISWPAFLTSSFKYPQCPISLMIWVWGPPPT